jgi:hypothetical protein
MRRTNARRVLGSLLAIAALALAGTAYASGPDSNGRSTDWHGHDRTIKLVEASEAVKPASVDLGQPGPSAGDLVVVRDGLLRQDGSKAGVLRQVCTLVDPGTSPLTSTFECSASFALTEGTIIAEGPFVPSASQQAAAVTGGTGAFSTAQGEASIRAEDDQITIRLVR